MIRTLLLFAANLIYQLITTPPNTGKELGKLEGDEKSSDGNNFISYKGRLTTIILFNICLMMNIYHYHDYPVSYLEILYFIVIVIGCGISLKAYNDLGIFYTFEIGTRKNHRLITTGLYKYLAHPGYTGQAMVLCSIILICNVYWFVTLLLLAYTIFRFYDRVINEELMLKYHFSMSYNKYLKERYRMIPYIW